MSESQQTERWRKLCEQAEHEQDPERLLELITEINRILGDPQDREHHPGKKSA